MKKAEWDAMKAECRDALVAEQVMKWEDLEGYWFGWKPSEGRKGKVRYPTGYYVFDGETVDRPGEIQWHPTTDRNACALVLDEIERRELWIEFEDAFIDESDEPLVDADSRFAIQFALRADPDFICYVAVKAVAATP